MENFKLSRYKVERDLCDYYVALGLLQLTNSDTSFQPSGKQSKYIT